MTEHHRRILVCFAGCSGLVTSECPDDPLTLRIPETIIGAVYGKSRARNLKGDTQDLGYTRSQVISRSSKPFPFSNIPPDRRNSLSCPATQQTFPLKTSSSYGAKRWRQDKRGRPGRWPSCANTQTYCGRITSACEPGWRPARLRNHGDHNAHFLHLVPINARMLLYPTTLTYQRMMSYLLTALRSHGVHHPRTLLKPNPEKGPLVDPSRSISIAQRGVWREASRDRRASRSQLMNMRPSDPGASPHRYNPCTLPSGLLPPHTCFSSPPFEDHNTCSPLPSVNIFWIMTLPMASLYRPSPCTTTHPIHTITCCILTKR